MQSIHVPKIDARYWSAITLASVFGTNLGDYYAHKSGLGIIGGLPILVAIVALFFVVERFDRYTHEAFYWLVIVIIRTGATNIADYLAYRVRLNMVSLCVALALLIAFLTLRDAPLKSGDRKTGLPDTNAKYWVAMLAAGVFGTVLGDVCSHAMGGCVASIVLAGILSLTLFAGRGSLLQTAYYYWLAVAVARTTGTAIGDLLAENHTLNLGLFISTLLSGTVFVLTLLLWRSRTRTTPVLT